MNKYFFKVLVSLFVLSVSIFTAVSFVVRPVKINDNAMAPKYNNGDYIIANVFNRTTNKIERNQVAVIKTENGYMVRRIIATPGSKVEMNNNTLVVNGNKDFQEYLSQEYMAKQRTLFTENFYVETGDDEYLVMGDNRVDASATGLKVHKADIISVGVFAGGDK